MDGKQPTGWRCRFSLRSLFLVTVLVAVYVASYVALVQRRPVYRGNGLRQLTLAFVVAGNFEGHASNAVQPARRLPGRRPDGYAAKYRLDHDFFKTIYRPIHWLDRQLRPAYWPRPRNVGC